MAESEGFEPSEPVKAQWFSRPPRSTTPATLQNYNLSNTKCKLIPIKMAMLFHMPVKIVNCFNLREKGSSKVV